MFQQIIAIIVILFIVSRVVWQRKKGQINKSEFVFWICFWILAGAAVLFLKKIDEVVAQMGFSGSGIEFLLYISVVVLFYLIFKIRLRIARLNREITKIVRKVALDEANINNSKIKNQKSK